MRCSIDFGDEADLGEQAMVGVLMDPEHGTSGFLDPLPELHEEGYVGDSSAYHKLHLLEKVALVAGASG